MDRPKTKGETKHCLQHQSSLVLLVFAVTCVFCPWKSRSDVENFRVPRPTTHPSARKWKIRQRDSEYTWSPRLPWPAVYQ